MKTLKIASIVGLTFGSVFLIFNIYMFLSPNPIFEDNDLPSLIVGFGTLITSIYLFIILKKVLNIVLKNTTANNFLLWIIRLEIVAGAISLYVLLSMLFIYFKGFINLVENPTNFVNSVFDLIFKVIILFGISIFLSVFLTLLGNKLRKQKNDKTIIILGVLLIIYGVIKLLTILTIIDNDFIAPIIECLSFILMGIIFKKYVNSDLTISSK